MKFILDVDLQHAAFMGTENPNDPDARGAEVARILRKLADKLHEYGLRPYADHVLLDANGNTVGHAKVVK